MAETNFRDDEDDRPGSGLEITLRRAANSDWQPQDRSRQATGSSGWTGSVTSSIVAQQHADNDAFNSSWDPYQDSAIA
ncbi:unnamed protein product [Tilletia controversa]|nr:unnamed protein product [Tilletia controversa]